jgi:hypothetical protein
MSRTVRIPPVEFSRGPAPAPDGGMVKRRGVIFRSGDYSASHQFTMTPEQLKEVASTFKGPIKLDHGHPSVDGPVDFGTLESVEASPDGTTLFGVTATPPWLNQAIGDARWLVSASFDRATRAIRRLSLVTRPAIGDAELRAAFACACGHEAEVEPQTEGEPMDEETEDDVLSDDDEQALDLFWGLPDGRRAEMLRALQDAAAPAPAPEPTAAEFAMRRELDQLKAERRADKIANFSAQSAAAVAVLKANALITPAAEADLIDLRTELATLDMDLGAPVDFSSGPATLTAKLDKVLATLKPHNFARPQLAEGRTLPNGGDGPESDTDYAARVVAKYNGRNRIAGR